MNPKPHIPMAGLLVSLLAAAPDVSSAADLSDLSWTSSGGEVTITDCDTSATGALAIPATIGGEPVRTIAVSAFRSCTSLESITLPDSVTTIESYAFISCTGLTSLSLGSGVESIGQRAFYRCLDLPGVTLPASLTSLGGEAFSLCDSLAAFTVAPGNPAYQSQDGVLFTAGLGQLIAFPNGRAGEYSVPTGVMTLRANAFSGSDLLIQVNLPASVVTIEPETFGNCQGLDALVVDPANPDFADIDGVLFDAGGSVLHSFPGGRTGRYRVPPGVTDIGDFAFSHASSLTGVSFPSSLTRIGYQAFVECRGLLGVVVPDSVTTIDWGAFYSCQGLLAARLPAGITSLPNYTFYDCRSLRSITLPAGVSSLGYACFAQCGELGCVTFEGAAPVVDDIPFENIAESPVAVVKPANTASFGGLGATWNGLLVIAERPMRITAAGFTTGGFFLDVEGGTSGLKVTSATRLPGPFSDQSGVVETGDDSGQPNRFLIPAAELPGDRAFFRAELDR